MYSTRSTNNKKKGSISLRLSHLMFHVEETSLPGRKESIGRIPSPSPCTLNKFFLVIRSNHKVCFQIIECHFDEIEGFQKYINDTE